MILRSVPAHAVPNAAAPAKPVSGATVYLVDQSGNLGTLDLGTRAVHVIFNTHQHLTNFLWLYPTPCRRRDGAGTVRCGLRRLVPTSLSARRPSSMPSRSSSCSRSIR